MNYPTGLDFCPLLEGLEHDHCQCPHWGYVIKGRVRVSYEDRPEEVVGAGELYYWPPGHTIVVEDAVRMIEFSPHDQMSEVLAHVVSEVVNRPQSNHPNSSEHSPEPSPHWSPHFDSAR